jgi:DNA-binding SARP family transcriptional activator/TolB-like protein
LDKAPFELRILGSTELVGPAPGGGAGDAILRQPKRLALLSYLALTTAEGFLRRDGIIAMFWPDLDQPQARTYLRKALYGINEALGVDVFVTRGEDEVRLDAAHLWCDAVALTQHVRDGHWDEALVLHRGDLLDGMFPEGVAQEFQEWLDDHRRILRGQAATAAWECSRIEEDRGDRKAAAVMARRALELTPDDEEGVRRLMSLLDRQGDRGGALRVYSDWQARLQKEYGVEPAPETRKLARRVQAARKGESHETPRTSAPVSLSLVPPAPPLDLTPTPDNAMAARLRSWRLLAVVASTIAIAAIVLAVVVARRGGGAPSGGPSSVAVVPLRSIGGSGAQGDADRVTEELTTGLAQIQGLVLRSMPPVGEMEGDERDAQLFGRRLGVAYVVYGAVQRGPGRLRVTLRLVLTADGISIWAGTFDSNSADPIARALQIAGEASVQIRDRVAHH